MKKRLRLFTIPVLVLVLCVTMCVSAFAAKPATENIASMRIGPSNNIAIVIAAAAVIAIGLVVIFTIKHKKKKTVTQNEVSGYAVETILDESHDSRTATGSMNDQTQPSVVGTCKLTGCGGIMNGQTYSISQDGATIGRSKDNSISYPEQTPGVSRHHLKIFWDSDGQLMLMDVGSSNGTYLDRMGKLTPMVPVPLKEGSVFYVGEQKNGFQVSFR